MTIQENLNRIKAELPKNVQLIAVSKTHPTADIQDAYEAGQRVFGENKVQELAEKYEQLPKDIQWHLIGHLQTNKVKYIAPFVTLIHAVDSLKLLGEINKQALKNNRIIDCLMQFHIAEEESKFGLDKPTADAILNSEQYKDFKNVNIVGVMGMATNTENTQQTGKEFENLKNIFNQLKSKYFADKTDFKELSMGMSSDYKTAIEQGSTMVRIGTAIFGKRDYSLRQ